jgi:hypothetical protein
VSRSNGLLRVLTLHCEEASELSSRSLDETLPGLDRAALLCHLIACRSCRRFRAQIQVIRDAVRKSRNAQGENESAAGRLSGEARTRIAQACRDAGVFDAETEMRPD